MLRRSSELDLTLIPVLGRGLFSNRRYHVEDKTSVVRVDVIGVRGDIALASE